jgi:ribosomal protein S18 acetylase RimI-like enzyme
MTQALIADAWLSGLLGRPAFHLSVGADPATPVAAPAFVDARVPTGDIARAQQVANASFRLVDTNVRLDRPPGALKTAAVKAQIRPAESRDAEGVKTIAGASFRFDRFHADPQIPNATADRIKVAWAGNFFSGARGNRMVVAADGASVLGFLQIIDQPEYSVIDLIAVAASAQGRGLAAAMIAYAIANRPAVAWRVGTQVANATSLRLYERMGFLVTESQYVFHRQIG